MSPFWISTLRLASVVTLLLVTMAGTARAESILLAIGGDEDTLFRDQIEFISQADVDFWDTSTSLPNLATVSSYDTVVTFVTGGEHYNSVIWGNRLADYVDQGGVLILPGSVQRLRGRITEPEYSPVYGDAQIWSIGPVDWEGTQTSRYHDFVRGYRTWSREWVGLRDDAITEGTWEGGAYTIASRPDRRIVYLNGHPGYGDSADPQSGDWARLIVNIHEAQDRKRVLVYDSSYSGRIVEAARKLGCLTTRVEDTSAFVAQLADPAGWDLIAVDFPGGLFDAETVTALESAFESEIPLLLQYWNLGDSSPIAADLRNLFGVQGTAELTTPSTIYSWIESHPIAVDPHPIASVPAGAEVWFDNGDRLTPAIGALGIAGFSPTRSISNAATISANNGRTLVNGFAFEELNLQRGLELAQNQVKFLLARSETLLLSTSNRNMAERATQRLQMPAAVARSIDVFETELLHHNWSTIIIDAPSGFLSSAVIATLTDFVAQGGRLHLNYWALSTPGASSLREALRIAETESYTTASTIYEWVDMPSNPVYLYPPFFPEDDAWTINGHRLTPASGALTILGFTSYLWSGNGAAILANDGFTLVNGFDYDSHESTDMLQLLRNQIRYVERAQVNRFLRGDCNQDQTRDISDPLFLANYVSGHHPFPQCRDACDANDDGRLDISDVVTQLASLFGPDSEPLPVPALECDADPTMDLLSCETPNCP